jgi:long-subunit fatty acid transport protein
MGLAGAFTALADDATAAFANPAGLVQLTRPEVSIEGRLWSYSTPFTLGGRFDGSQPSGILLDNTSGLRTAESSQDLAGLSFLSFVYPKNDWSLAVYRHQSANFEYRSETQGLFARASPPFEDRREIDFRSTVDLDVVNHGVSVAYRLREGFSLGLGVSYLNGKFASETQVFFPNPRTLPQGFFGPNSYDPQSRLITSLIAIDDSDWTFNMGFLWHVSQQWSVGGFFRQGPEFLLETRTLSGPFLQDIPEGTVLDSVESPIGLPNVFGLGVAFKSKNEAVTVLAEWDRVQYSNILDSLDPDNFDTVGSALDDANELRAGFEYVFLNWTPVVAIRLGTWLDPDHRLRDLDDPVGQALFRAGDDELHFTAGFGIAFPRFQIDLGFDLSDVVKTASVSTVFSF